ncbi:hypothetical protein AAGX49_14540 [Staphylococcus aureus]
MYNKEIEIAQDKRFDRLLKSKENPGFLIDTENFTSEGGELPLYKMNEEENNSIEPDGKTIIVDPNYLKRHHMVTPQSEDVLRYIQHDKYTRNILVPIKFKRYEHKIRKNFTKDFKFKRTLYDDIRKDHAPAHINIIYVKTIQSILRIIVMQGARTIK